MANSKHYTTHPQPHEQLLMGWIAGGMMTMMMMTRAGRDDDGRGDGAGHQVSTPALVYPPCLADDVPPTTFNNDDNDNDNDDKGRQGGPPPPQHPQLPPQATARGVETGCNEDGDDEKAPNDTPMSSCS